MARGHAVSLGGPALTGAGQRPEVDKCLDQVATIAQILPAFYTFGALFLRAQCAFRDHDETQGTMWLRRLMEEGKKRQQIIFVGWVPKDASQLFAKALEHGIELPYACEVIRKVAAQATSRWSFAIALALSDQDSYVWEADYRDRWEGTRETA